MKHKILVNGKNSALVIDFIRYTDVFFKSLSTTECWQDVTGHFELFKPDAYLCFVDSVYSNIFTHINNLKKNEHYNGAHIFFVCDAETCDEIEKDPKVDVDLIIRRPVTADNLALRITRYFDELKEAEEKAKAEADAKAIKKDSEERKHILVIDDDRLILKMLKSALSDKYDVTTMVNGVVAEKFLETKKVDMIILDYEMPIETGAEVFKKIKNNPKISHIPVCFLTGVSDREKIMDVMALKPHGYLLKPIDMDMLSATIKNLIN